MLKRKGIFPCSVLVQFYVILLTIWMVRASASASSGRVVKKEERWPVVSTAYGEISAARVSDGVNASYLLHFFSLDPNSVFLPAVLNADMLFYVHAGRGQLSWTEEEELKHIELRRGDVYRLLRGTVFYMQTESDEAEQQRLKIHAIFPNSNDDLREPETEPYTSIQDMVLGFDTKILQATFKVSEEVIGELLSGTKPEAITHADQFCGGLPEINKKKKEEKEKEKEKKEKGKGKEKEKEKEQEKEKEKKGKKQGHTRLFNIFEAEKEIENCNGWSTTVTKKQLPALEGTNIGLFMVNLEAGSMMGPHWNDLDTEVVVILEGRGMVRVSNSNASKGKSRFEVEQGDAFAVARSQAMAEMAFNNGSLVYMGFSRMAQGYESQFLGGDSSVLQILKRQSQVLEMAFNVERKTMDQLLSARGDTRIASCISCAEEEMKQMIEEGDEGRQHHHQHQHQRKHAGEEEREGEEEGGAGWRHGGERERWEEEAMPPHNDGGARRILKNKMY